MSLNDKNKVVKFGVNQVGKPTPPFLNWTFRIILYLSGLYVVVFQPMLNLPTEQVLLIDKILAGANLFVHFTTRFFGLDFKN